MNKLLLVALCFVPAISCFSQIHFEKGYLIDASAQKIECLIRNVDWQNNPTRFDYKLSESSEELKGSVTDVSEFAIYGAAKFVRAAVRIDRSEQKVDGMSTTRNPEFQNETLFLRVLVEGKADLYQFIDSKSEKYFFKTPLGSIEQLVYKKYEVVVGKIGDNNLYRQQLLDGLKCTDMSLKDFESIHYRRKELEKVFIKYNKCNGDIASDDPKELPKTSNRNWFNLTVRPGIEFSSLSVRNTQLNSLNMDFDNKMTFRLGMEAEFILPFNKNKWAITLEPTFQYYDAETVNRGENVKVDYKSLEVPVGIRHYFFLSDQSRLYIGAALVLDYDVNSIIDYENNSLDLVIKPNPSYNFSVGYRFNRYSLEFRYVTPRNILAGYTYYATDYKKTSIVVGYSLFRQNSK